MSFHVICFDCDSTLSKIEGIDELAGRVGLGKEMAKLTDAAMNGLLPLEAVYEKRLSVLRPDLESIRWLADLYIAEVVDGALEVFASLTAEGKEVHIISGGIRQAILPLAAFLGLPENHVHAVELYFNDDGSYRDFDKTSPLSRTGGKGEVCRQLLKPHGPLLMIGDGQTDMEARQQGVTVFCFGGVIERPLVREMADQFIAGPSLTSLLTHIS